MHRDRRTLVTTPLLGILLLLATIPACVSYRPPDPEAVQQAYRAAIRDAAVAEPWEISRQLRAVKPAEAGLRWHDDGRLLVVSWTHSDSFSPGLEVELRSEMWVTLVPDVQELCRKIRPAVPEHRKLRLQQLLGLPPEEGTRRFVELWVSTSDLYRPCPDPEITDHECELTYRESNPYLTLAPEYRQWFDELVDESYDEERGYPWTRLGYTYDWGNPDTEEGLSEFIIRAGAPVETHDVAETARYCS